MEGEASPSKIADETVNLDNTVTADPAGVSVDVEHDKHTDEPSAEQTKAQMKDGMHSAQGQKVMKPYAQTLNPRFSSKSTIFLSRAGHNQR